MALWKREKAEKFKIIVLISSLTSGKEKKRMEENPASHICIGLAWQWERDILHPLTFPLSYPISCNTK